MKDLNKKEFNDKLRTLCLEIDQNDIYANAGQITEREWKHQRNRLKRKIRKLEFKWGFHKFVSWLFA